MPLHTQHRILFATDGSRSAQAALATAVLMPWPASSVARIVIARTSWLPADSDWLPAGSAESRAAFEKNFEAEAAAARRALASRWPDTEVMFLDTSPRDAILAEAARFEASLIVLGWRGHSQFRRLLSGSVSRSIAEQATCSVLVVRQAANTVRRFVLGFDDDTSAEPALAFLGSLDSTQGSSVVLVHVVQPIHVPHSAARLPSSLRMPIRRQVTAIKLQRRKQGRAALLASAARLEQDGWAVQSDVRVGDPLASLLAAVEEHRADVLVAGARTSLGRDEALLGTVARGAMDRSTAAVLIVR